jgi:hypothetical protein
LRNYLHQSWQHKNSSWANECIPDHLQVLSFSIRKHNGIHRTNITLNYAKVDKSSVSIAHGGWSLWGCLICCSVFWITKWQSWKLGTTNSTIQNKLDCLMTDWAQTRQFACLFLFIET